MSNRIVADVNPVVLVWARVKAGLTAEEAAAKLNTSLEVFYSWESGDAQPTMRQARALGKIYRRPAAIFFLDLPPATPKQIRDFRRLPENRRRTTPELAYEIDRAFVRREIALDLYRDLEINAGKFDLVHQSNNTSVIAKSIRSFLEITDVDQLSDMNKYKSLKRWVDLVEKKGVLVFQFSNVEVDIARGFSLNERPLPIISLNGKDSPRAKIFTLLHELCHLSLGEGGICDLKERRGTEEIEVFCNAVAAEVFVPTELLLEQKLVNQNPEAPKWSDSALRSLSNRFGASREVILRRLLTLGLTTESFYAKKRKEFLEQYQEEQEEKRGFFNHPGRVFRDNGLTFTSLVYDAYRHQRISILDLSRMLGGLRLDHFEAVGNQLRG